MPDVKIIDFKGTIPKTSSKLLTPNVAQVAKNCDLSSGQIKPIKSYSVGSSLGSTAWRSFYYYSDAWITWDEYVDVVRAQVESDAEKTFYTGDGYPKQFTTALMPTGGTPDGTDDYRKIGVPKPVGTLSYTLQGTGDGTVVDSISYVYTYVVTWADGTEEESEPSDASVVIDVEGGEYISVNNFTVPPSLAASGCNITHIRLYRLSTSTTGAVYQLVNGRVGSEAGTVKDTYTADPATPPQDIDNIADTIWDCNAASGSTALSTLSGTALATEDWIQPPATMKGLVQYQNGMLAGFIDNVLYISEPYIPYAWPDAYTLNFNHDIVALGVYNESLIVTTTANPHIVTGAAPEYLTQQILTYNQANVSKEGLVSSPVGVIYPSPDGLYIVTNTEALNLTRDIYTKDQWAALNPSTLFGFYHDGVYYGFFKGSGTGIAINLSAENMYAIALDYGDYDIYNFWMDAANDAVYLLAKYTDNNYYPLKMEGHGTTKLTYTWKSGIIETPKKINIPFAKIIGDQSVGEPITFIFYADGVSKVGAGYSITDSEPFRLPSGFRSDEFEVQVSGTADIDSIWLMETL